MSTQTTAPAVPFWPHVEAWVRTDGTGQVSIDGTVYPVTAGTVDAAREAVLTVVRSHSAGPLGRPVRVDTSDPSGEWQLLVHPDGSVSDAREGEDPGALPQRTHPRPAATPTGATVRPTPGTSPAAAEAPDRTGTSSRVVPFRPIPSAPASDRQDTGRPPVAPALATPAPAPTAPAPQPDPDLDPVAAGRARPTLQDLLTARAATPVTHASTGWQAAVRHATGGRISPAPSRRELARRELLEAVQRPLSGGPKTIVVANPKGGAHKTTATVLLAATIGSARGGYTLAWDNNETRGTLGWRAGVAPHHHTAVDLLRDVHRFTTGGARVADLDEYVRSQGSARYDVLASDEDAASAASINGQAFRQLHDVLSRFYRVLVVDTGNNMRASNWQAAIEAADQLVIVSTVREDTAQSAAWLADALAAAGRDELVTGAVTVLSAPGHTVDPALRARVHEHFGSLTRVVVDVPHEPSLVAGGPIVPDLLAPATQDAWLRAAAAVVDGL